jgi:hypothetical protein
MYRNVLWRKKIVRYTQNVLWWKLCKAHEKVDFSCALIGVYFTISGDSVLVHSHIKTPSSHTVTELKCLSGWIEYHYTNKHKQTYSENPQEFLVCHGKSRSECANDWLTVAMVWEYILKQWALITPNSVPLIYKVKSSYPMIYFIFLLVPRGRDELGYGLTVWSIVR